MKIIKRNGSEVEFDKSKIFKAILKANSEVEDCDKLLVSEIQTISDNIENEC